MNFPFLAALLVFCIGYGFGFAVCKKGSRLLGALLFGVSTVMIAGLIFFTGCKLDTR